MINIDDFSPRYVGDTGNPLTVTFTDHIVDPLTGKYTPYTLAGLTNANFAFHMKNMSTGVTVNGLGTWTVTIAASGIAQYAWNASDVASSGTFGISATVTFAGGPLTFDMKILTIL